MDTTTKPLQAKAGESEIDALAERLSLSWTHSPGPRGAAGQILQRLAHGRLHPVTVESKRARRRSERPR